MRLCCTQRSYRITSLLWARSASVGIEPAQAVDKTAALSTELRGPRKHRKPRLVGDYRRPVGPSTCGVSKTWFALRKMTICRRNASFDAPHVVCSPAPTLGGALSVGAPRACSRCGCRACSAAHPSVASEPRQARCRWRHPHGCRPASRRGAADRPGTGLRRRSETCPRRRSLPTTHAGVRERGDHLAGGPPLDASSDGFRAGAARRLASLEGGGCRVGGAYAHDYRRGLVGTWGERGACGGARATHTRLAAGRLVARPTDAAMAPRPRPR